MSPSRDRGWDGMGWYFAARLAVIGGLLGLLALVSAAGALLTAYEERQPFLRAGVPSWTAPTPEKAAEQLGKLLRRLAH